MTDFAFAALLPETIETDRLILRAPQISDAPALCRLANNYKVAEMLLRLPHPYVEADAIEFITKIARSKTEHAYAILSHDKTFMGVSGLFTPAPGKIEIGYWLGEPYWRNGYMTEAATALIAAYFTASNNDTLHAGYFADNFGSGRVQQKLGFTEVAPRTVSRPQSRKIEIGHINTILHRDNFAHLDGPS